MTEQEKIIRAALIAAREEINWWAREHGCCVGHELAVLNQIGLALGEPSIEELEKSE